MWGGIIPIVAGLPIRLVAFARWKQDHCAVNVDLIESFQLSLNQVTKDWHGSSSNDGPNLAIEVASLAEKNHFDVELMLRIDLAIVDSHTWHDVIVPDRRPLDTDLLQHVIQPDRWFYQLHARG